MAEIEISPRAYVKMCLHAARYPHAAVNGLLLAQRHQATGGQSECLCITDCVPLFHCSLSLTVMLEVALNQVDIWGSEANLLLAGYYQANSGIDDKSPSPLAQKAAGRIAELYDEAVLIMLEPGKLSLKDLDVKLDMYAGRIRGSLRQASLLKNELNSRYLKILG